jgi:hypothetical protein
MELSEFNFDPIQFEHYQTPFQYLEMTLGIVGHTWLMIDVSTS